MHWGFAWHLLVLIVTITTEAGLFGIAESFYQKQKRIVTYQYVVVLGPYLFWGGGG